MDLIQQEKNIIEKVIEDMGTRTYGYTIPFTQANVHKTTYKDFKFFIKAGEHSFLTEKTEKLPEFKVGESIIMEIASKSQYVLKVRKIEHERR